MGKSKDFIPQYRFHELRLTIESRVASYRSGAKQKGLDDYTPEELWRALGIIGDWNKTRSEFKDYYANPKFKSPWGYDWRKTDFSLRLRGTQPNEIHATKFIRALARFYTFIAPTADVLKLCKEMCDECSVSDYMPGSLIIGSAKIHSNRIHIEPCHYITFFDLLVSTSCSPAIAEFARYGFIAPSILELLFERFELTETLWNSWEKIVPSEPSEQIISSSGRPFYFPKTPGLVQLFPLFLWITSDTLNPLQSIDYTGSALDNEVGKSETPNVYHPNWTLAAAFSNNLWWANSKNEHFRNLPSQEEFRDSVDNFNNASLATQGHIQDHINEKYKIDTSKVENFDNLDPDQQIENYEILQKLSDRRVRIKQKEGENIRYENARNRYLIPLVRRFEVSSLMIYAQRMLAKSLEYIRATEPMFPTSANSRDFLDRCAIVKIIWLRATSKNDAVQIMDTMRCRNQEVFLEEDWDTLGLLNPLISEGEKLTSTGVASPINITLLTEILFASKQILPQFYTPPMGDTLEFAIRTDKKETFHSSPLPFLTCTKASKKAS